jgi:hypothetical protein
VKSLNTIATRPERIAIIVAALIVSADLSHRAHRKTRLTRVNDQTIRRVLEAAGVEFLDANGGGPGVRLRGAQQEKNQRVRCTLASQSRLSVDRSQEDRPSSSSRSLVFAACSRPRGISSIKMAGVRESD